MNNIFMLFLALMHEKELVINFGTLLINRDGDFADFSAFADFFSVVPIFRISADFCSSEL